MGRVSRAARVVLTLLRRTSPPLTGHAGVLLLAAHSSCDNPRFHQGRVIETRNDDSPPFSFADPLNCLV